MKKYECTVCHWVYDPQVGDPDNGVEPGTSFEQIPDDWSCPLCGVSKEEFEKLIAQGVNIHAKDTISPNMITVLRLR